MNLSEFYRGKRVLVTGNTGFKGAWLTRILTLLGAEVTGYSMDAPTDPAFYHILKLDETIRQVTGDIRDLTNMPNDSQGTIRYGRLNMRSFLRRVKRDFAVWNQITPVPAGCAVCMTHLNEYDHCGARNKLVKYKSSSEEGAGCVTLNNNTR